MINDPMTSISLILLSVTFFAVDYWDKKVYPSIILVKYISCDLPIGRTTLIEIQILFII